MVESGSSHSSFFPLLVRSQEFVVNIARTLIHDVDLDECLKHETDALGDSGLFDLMRVSNGPFLHPFFYLLLLLLLVVTNV